MTTARPVRLDRPICGRHRGLRFARLPLGAPGWRNRGRGHERRLADEYDAAQGRGEVSIKVPLNPSLPTAQPVEDKQDEGEETGETRDCRYEVSHARTGDISYTRSNIQKPSGPRPRHPLDVAAVF